MSATLNPTAANTVTTVDLTPEAPAAVGRALATAGPLHMVNLLRFHLQADYRGRTEFAPCSGREAYMQRYVPAFNKIAEQVAGAGKVTVALLCEVHATLVAPAGEAWDVLAVVQFPDAATLRGILESPAYAAEAETHRLAALADWRYFATTKVAPSATPA